MKLKKWIVALLVSIMILTFSTNVLAVKAKEDDESNVSNSTENVVENKVENKTENKVENKTENKTKNEVKNETTVKDTEKKDTDKTSGKTSDKKSETTAKKKLINKDIASAKSEDIEYKNVLVKGNMFLAGGEKVKLNNIEVDGDVFVFATDVVVTGCEIQGNLFVASDNIKITDSEIMTSYLAGENIEVGKDAKISRELRAVGTTVTLDGEVGRDFDTFCDRIVIEKDAKISGKATVNAGTQDISDKADIDEIDYQQISYNAPTASKSEKVTEFFISKGTTIGILLLLTIFILGGFPKFTEVNSSLRLRDFVRSFFTGLLEFVVMIAIAVGLFITGYGAGYGLLLLNILFILLILGKMMFVISFAIRMSCNPESKSRVKAFFATVLVGIVLALIEMLSLAGEVGAVIVLALDSILAMSGFGAMFRVIFTSKKRLTKLSEVKLGEKSVKIEEVKETPAPEKEVKEDVKEEVEEKVEESEKEEPKEEKIEEEKTVVVPEETVTEELTEEIKNEVKEEVKELKEERKEEKNDKKDEDEKEDK